MLEVIDVGEVRELRFARPPVNALDPELLERLTTGIEAAPGQGARAIVMSGQPGLYSAGLDVRVLLGLDEAGMRDYMTLLWRAQSAIARAPVPVIAAITGHAPAGGTALIVYCDYRIMAAGPFRLGLNEVEVGLTAGPILRRAYERLLGEHRAAEMLVRGALVEPDRALAIGLVDEVVIVEEVIARAHEYAQALLALPPGAVARTRADARAGLASLFDGDGKAWVTDALEVWYSKETQARLTQLFRK